MSNQTKLALTDPAAEVNNIVSAIQNIFQKQHKKNAVIAVSGGIDSAVSVTLLTKALGPQAVTTLFLPYQAQSITDAQAITTLLKIPPEQQIIVNIADIVAAAAQELQPDKLRLGNLMARSRMMVVYDYAKKLAALVCGTENKSEKYLGYFTRFGDEASDLEPIQHLYKTQIRQLAAYLAVPQEIQIKTPSAGLWENQNDESELGFDYTQADQVLWQYIDQAETDPAVISRTTQVSQSMVEQVIQQVESMAFKHQVPYLVE